MTAKQPCLSYKAEDGLNRNDEFREDKSNKKEEEEAAECFGNEEAAEERGVTEVEEEDGDITDGEVDEDGVYWEGWPEKEEEEGYVESFCGAGIAFCTVPSPKKRDMPKIEEHLATESEGIEETLTNFRNKSFLEDGSSHGSNDGDKEEDKEEEAAASQNYLDSSMHKYLDLDDSLHLYSIFPEEKKQTSSHRPAHGHAHAHHLSQWAAGAQTSTDNQEQHQLPLQGQLTRLSSIFSKNNSSGKEEDTSSGKEEDNSPPRRKSHSCPSDTPMFASSSNESSSPTKKGGNRVGLQKIWASVSNHNEQKQQQLRKDPLGRRHSYCTSLGKENVV